MPRARAIVILAVALIGGIMATGAWLLGRRPEAHHAEEEKPADPMPAPGPDPDALGAREGAPVRADRTPRMATPAAAAPAPDEEVLAGIRAHVRSDPRKAESLAREARVRFPNSPHTDEWDALLVDALVNQQRIGAARSETYYYYDHHPAGAFTAHLFGLTGVHPSPVGPGPH